MKRPAAVFKTSSIGGNVVPSVKLKARDAILQAVVQRIQDLIPEVLDMINEAFVHDSRTRICVEFAKRQGWWC